MSIGDNKEFTRANTLRQAHEQDPTGRDQHAPGAKLDAGKVRPDLILSGMPRALLAVARVATFGAEKYTENGWTEVPEGVKRYTAALDRHRLRGELEEIDADSGLLHAAHLAWNALARLELMLREADSWKGQTRASKEGGA